jgi:hypothetical protein
MSIIESSFTIKGSDQIQICLSKGFDPEVVATNLRLCPLVFRVNRINGQAEECTLLVTHPRGIVMQVLPKEDANKPYYADPFGQMYSRLKMNRHPGAASMIIGNEENDVLIDDLENTRTNPLVVSGLFSDKAIGFQLVFAAPRSWLLKREEHCDIKVATDAYAIPPMLRDMLDTSKIVTPKGDAEKQTLWQKMKNIDETAVWYGNRVLSESTREELTFLHAEFKSALIEIEASLPLSKPASGAVEFENTIRRVLSQEFGKAKSKEIMNNVRDILQPKVLEERKGQIKTIKDFTSLLTGMSHIELFKSIVNNNLLPELPPNPCVGCGNTPIVRLRSVGTRDLSKELHFVQCQTCKIETERNDWGLRDQVISVWNKQNPIDSKPDLPSVFDIIANNENTLLAGMKSLSGIITRAREMLKNMAPEDRNRMRNQRLDSRLMALEMWCHYIRSSYAYINRLKQDAAMKEKTANTENQ